MLKVLTSTEASFIALALRQAIEVLEAEGYEYEAQDCQEAYHMLANLCEKEADEVIE